MLSFFIHNIMLLLLLSRFSRVRLCVTPLTAAHQAPLSLGFSRQEHWSGLPFPSPVHGSEKWKWSHSVVSDSLRPHGLQPTRLLHPWDFPGKSTGVGWHCLLHPHTDLVHILIYTKYLIFSVANVDGIVSWGMSMWSTHSWLAYQVTNPSLLLTISLPGSSSQQEAQLYTVQAVAPSPSPSSIPWDLPSLLPPLSSLLPPPSSIPLLPQPLFNMPHCRCLCPEAVPPLPSPWDGSQGHG